MQGLERLAEYDYVAIFDADFKPDADFLVGHSSLLCAVTFPQALFVEPLHDSTDCSYILCGAAAADGALPN